MRNPDDVHVPFLVSSLLLATIGGFTLAVSLPFEAALGGFDVGWVAHAQVHGHIQVVGFGALFVVGVALKLAPRFAGRRGIAAEWALSPGLALVVAGVLARSLGQPLADHSAFAVVLSVGAFAELAGAVLLAAALVGTLWGGIRKLDPSALLLGAAAVWLVVQAALGAWWLTVLANDGNTLLVSQRNNALVNMQFFGVILSAVLGVGTRTFPTFFGQPPTSKPLGIGVFALLSTGVLAWTWGTAWSTPDAVAEAGRAAVGAAILLAVATFGLARMKHRLAAASSGYVWALQPVLFWLAVTGALLLWSGARPLAGGSLGTTEEVDAIRHIFALGVVTLAIVAMAQLILPEFASERLVRQPSKWRGAAFGASLSVAVVLRGVLPWLGGSVGIEGNLRWTLMGVGGVIGMGAAVAFALLYWRARRSHVAYRRRVEAMRSKGASLSMADG